MTTADDILDLLATGSRYLFLDNFASPDPWDTAVTETGSVDIRMLDTILQTGILATSTARMNYTNSLFNPLYSRADLHVRIPSKLNVKAFFGFMETLTTPTLTMTQSHAGIFIQGGIVYWSTGNGASLSPTCQNTTITQLDVSRDIIYKLTGQSVRWFPLPLSSAYFAEITNSKPAGTWSNTYANGSSIPKDAKHYLVFYIENTTNQNQQMYVSKIGYRENNVD